MVTKMVNVPPIPPLLCSTPPPIDFGEDDEDVDAMPPTLDGVDDDDFADFLTVDDRKTNEPPPSQRPPSFCDLPPVSIYDGFITHDDEEDTTKQTSPLPPISDDRSGREIKNNTKSIYITEAFNFNIKNSSDEYKKKTSVQHKSESFMPQQQTVETNEPTEDDKNQNEIEAKSNFAIEDSQLESQEKSQESGSKNLKRNVKDLTVEATNEESRCESNDTNKTNMMKCMQNVVSIEDIEDDLSDDELYSPKTPKNFMEADNLNDYFTIQEIKPAKSETPKVVLDTKSFDSLDNNESASLENDNEYKSFSSNSFPNQNLFDMPPPLLDEETKSIDDNDDDFGDFADFQDFSAATTPPETQNFVNNVVVPAEDINNKQRSNSIEINGFNEFTDYNTTTKEPYNVIKKEDSVEDNKEEFDKFASQIYAVSTETSENEREIISQEISNNNFGNFNTAAFGNVKETDESNNADESFGDFSADPRADTPDNAETFIEKENAVATYSNENSELSNDDDFGDFADFESHQEISKPEENISIENAKSQSTTIHESEHENIDEENDDDFGDFNTAQPITPTASSLAQYKTSQNIIAATPQTTTLTIQNLNERVSKILHILFSPFSNDNNENDEDEDIKPKTNKIQDIPFTSIDAAKALEYQWLNSDTRHSFIKSLGIDSRNILFGENWNPSLPRFAANLSFNPLKPMKPTPCTSSTTDYSTDLDSTAVETLGTNKTLDVTGSTMNDNLEINSKTLNLAEHANKAHKDNNLTTMPEPPAAEPVSLTLFENHLENENTFSKTPPISEMESVTTFSSPSPSSNAMMDIDTNNITNSVSKETEENLDNALNINEVVVTSTFTGSFKETHIYTPSKTNDFDTKQTTISTATASTTSLSSPSKSFPIDFDYEKAAMGVIIDETVVKKEYRDVEYNPPFSMESLSKSAVMVKTEMCEANIYSSNANVLENAKEDVSDECSDDFTEFQSVPSEVTLPAATTAAITNEATVAKSKPTTIAHGGMILSPAILIPQAISMENQKPKIEWGDSTATINPEELARIEELFPEPKTLKSSSNASNSSQKSTPTHQVASTPSISATVANKELEGSINNTADDDDDWSDFVSVSVTNNTSSANRLTSNNNNLTKSPVGSPFKQRSPVVNHRIPSSNTLQGNSNNDDDWSDFVSSAPPTSQPNPSTSYRVPQFNSGAWQNANFYNNPLSMYHKGPLNLPTTATKSIYNNNNNYSNISQQPYQIANNLQPPAAAQQVPNNVYHQHHHQQQQIHVMQNFSTAPVPTPERLTAAAVAAKNNQFQVGSAKVAPSIALIPDLGFVAPAIPTHTSFINSLPKPSISTKK